jgi:hypothetical protein
MPKQPCFRDFYILEGRLFNRGPDGCVKNKGRALKRKHTARASGRGRTCSIGRQRLVLYVVRVLADGSLGSSRPCASCMQHIHHAGIWKVRYSSDDRTVVEENAQTMTSTHQSYGARAVQDVLSKQT